ncbi:MAG: hypothetical protein ABMA25_21965 [Ilumatobacteraceae bacterium]
MRYDILMWTGAGMVIVGAAVVAITFIIDLFPEKNDGSKPKIANDDPWAALFIEILKDKRSFLIALGLAIMAGTKYALG